MIRRHFVAILAGLPILGFFPWKREFTSPIFSSMACGLRSGKAVKLEYLLDIGFSFWDKQANYPTVSTIRIIYEHGQEEYLCFNMLMNDASKLSLQSLFQEGKFINGQLPEIIWKGYKLKLSSVFVCEYGEFDE